MRSLGFVVILSNLLIAENINASVIPIGVQTNVSATTVFNSWNWKTVWQSRYNISNIPIEDVFDDVKPDQYVMLAAKPIESDTFTVLAAALESDVRTYTPFNVTHEANGTEWYYNGTAMGFAGLGDVIDISRGVDTLDSNGELRLSWLTAIDQNGDITGNHSVPPDYVNAGWRAGTAKDLTRAANWERYILVAIPEPTTSVHAVIVTLFLIRRRGR